MQPPILTSHTMQQYSATLCIQTMYPSRTPYTTPATPMQHVSFSVSLYLSIAFIVSSYRVNRHTNKHTDTHTHTNTKGELLLVHVRPRNCHKMVITSGLLLKCSHEYKCESGSNFCEE